MISTRHVMEEETFVSYSSCNCREGLFNAANGAQFILKKLMNEKLFCSKITFDGLVNYFCCKNMQHLKACKFKE